MVRLWIATTLSSSLSQSISLKFILQVESKWRLFHFILIDYYGFYKRFITLLIF